MDNAIERPGAIALFDVRTGRLVRNLTSASKDRSPTLAPDGRSVAFERSGAIYRVAVGCGRPVLIQRGTQRSWSR